MVDLQFGESRQFAFSVSVVDGVCTEGSQCALNPAGNIQTYRQSFWILSADAI